MADVCWHQVHIAASVVRHKQLRHIDACSRPCTFRIWSRGPLPSPPICHAALSRPTRKGRPSKLAVYDSVDRTPPCCADWKGVSTVVEQETAK